ncbi:DUF5518 domain-containing protein [Halolamina sp.]|uniref:DUF5518 domain-containing protein n=1 Tax=Halolamina sp. TaxID=1940283 RepID=UPI003568D01A
MSERSSEPTPPERDSGAGDSTERAPNTLLNGLIGSIVSVLLSFLPFSTVLGGAVAGYLEGGDAADGAKVGTIGGLIAFVPVVLIILVVALFVPVAGMGMQMGTGMGLLGGGVALAFWVSLFALLLFAAVYTVGFSVLGGVLGVYLKENA